MSSLIFTRAIVAACADPCAPIYPGNVHPGITRTQRVAAFFDSSIKRALPDLGVKPQFSTAPLRDVLNWQPRPIEQSIIDTAESLIQLEG